MIQVTLSNGFVVDVVPVPPFALAAVNSSLMTGEKTAIEAADVARVSREAAWLLAMPSLEVVKGWEFPSGLHHAGIRPRDGGAGEKLDYIEYGLLQTADDIERVQRAMYGELTEEEIGVAEDTFQPDSGPASVAADPA